MTEEPAEKVVNKMANLWNKHPVIMGLLGVAVVLVVAGCLIYIFAKKGKKETKKE